MELPKQLEELRNRKIWLCYPMIWNETKHNGVGGYDKPPVNPYTLYNGSSSDPESLATYDKAAAQIGKTAHVRVKDHDGLVHATIVGVGIALSGTGIAGIDLDNVVDIKRRVMTHEAGQIRRALESYTEVSPSGTGLHILFIGELPPDVKKIAKPKPDIFGTEKAEYQLFDSGYMTISGDVVGEYDIAERTEQMKQVYDDFFLDVPPILIASTEKPTPTKPKSSSVVSSGSEYDLWLSEARTLSDEELLERIFATGKTGEKVKALYDGDTSQCDNDHSRADLALCTYLYGFTDDQETTERLFRSSKLYRAKGKSRNYINRTLNKAAAQCVRLVGHMEYTPEQRKAYGQQKYTAEQRKAYAQQREQEENRQALDEWLKRRLIEKRGN